MTKTFTPEKPGGYFFVWFTGFNNRQKQSSEAYASYEAAVVGAFNLRLTGDRPTALCYVPPYDGKGQETILPIEVVEQWGE